MERPPFTLPELPEDPTLGELPRLWSINVRCTCLGAHSIAVWQAVEFHGPALKLATFLARLTCNSCRSRNQPTQLIMAALENGQRVWVKGDYGTLPDPTLSIPLALPKPRSPARWQQQQPKTPPVF